VVKSPSPKISHFQFRNKMTVVWICKLSHNAPVHFQSYDWKLHTINRISMFHVYSSYLILCNWPQKTVTHNSFSSLLQGEVDHCSSSLNFSTILNYKYTSIKMDSTDKHSTDDAISASHIGNKLRLIQKNSLNFNVVAVLCILIYNNLSLKDKWILSGLDTLLINGTVHDNCWK
jgi:hypothetical protein